MNVPVVANGDVTSLDDAIRTRDVTGVDGVMVARALLENPALFQGYQVVFNPVIRFFRFYSDFHNTAGHVQKNNILFQ